MTEESAEARIAALEAELRRVRAAWRRDLDELDWAQEQVRVLRRLVARLLRAAKHLA